jgi:UDP-N-acetylmuramate: L-alanyl-gamma-D-glutamyl-meso-diaminopimelate ligase
LRPALRYHLIGICGTGMGAVAGLLKAAGHDVRGSDSAVYPPMSDQLAALHIPVFDGFAPANLDWKPDVVVVGNVCSKDHVEVVAAQERGLPLTSFPSVLGDLLEGRHSIVVSGTHGKTTTTSILAHLLVEAGRDPSCFIGGVPVAFGQGWRAGTGTEFILEGDEYDSAFFDKGSKFLHYRPRTAVLTSVELDHVDIFASMDQVRDAFRRFVALIPPDGLLIVAGDQHEAALVAQEARCRVETYTVDRGQPELSGEIPLGPTWRASKVEYLKSGRCRFEVRRSGETFDTFETLLSGSHNVGNCLAAIAVAASLGLTVTEIRRGLASFAGVRRRQELRGIASGVYVLDDYAHHPTAVRETLRALRKRFPSRRLIAVYEPRSATSRRRTFQNEFVEAFSHADEVVVCRLYDPARIPKEERFDPEKLALELHQRGTQASYIPEPDAIVKHIAASASPGDVVVVLSSGAFEGLHERLLAALGDAVMPARVEDMPRIRALASRVRLPVDDLGDDAYQNFFCLSNESGFAACVGLEVYGEDAILRSLAVDPAWRGNGYGWMLADTAISQARYRGVRRIYLLTETASDFFAAKHGFRVVDRSTVAPTIAQTRTFIHADPVVVAMRLDL